MLQRPICCGEIFLSQEFGAKFLREVPLFLKVPEFRYKSAGSVEGSSHAKNQLCSAISVEHGLVTDRHRYRQTQGHS